MHPVIDITGYNGGPLRPSTERHVHDRHARYWPVAAIAHADALSTLGITPGPDLANGPHPSLADLPRRAVPGGAFDRALTEARETDRADALMSLAQRYRAERQSKIIDMQIGTVARGLVDERFNGRRADAEAAVAAAMGPAAQGRADANLNTGVGLEANLTSLLYMTFREPDPAITYRDFATIRGGWQMGLLYLQMIFLSASGEAKIWDGGAGGDYEVSPLGVDASPRKIYHMLSESTWGMLAAARAGMMGLNFQTEAVGRLRFAHDLAHDRIFWTGCHTDGIDLDGVADLNIPRFDPGYDLDSVTHAQMLDQMVSTCAKPLERTKGALKPDMLGIGPKTARKIKSLRNAGSGASVLADFMDSFGAGSDQPIRLAQSHRLQALMATGTESMIALDTSRPDSGLIYFMQPVEMFPDWQGVRGSLTVSAHSATAGAFCAYPVTEQITDITT